MVYTPNYFLLFSRPLSVFGLLFGRIGGRGSDESMTPVIWKHRITRLKIVKKYPTERTVCHTSLSLRSLLNTDVVYDSLDRFLFIFLPLLFATKCKTDRKCID